MLDVLRRHLQEVLLAINTSVDRPADRAPNTPILMTPVDPSSPTAMSPVAAATVVHDPISFDNLLGVPPEYREEAFMNKYFAAIRPRVTSTDSADHHDPQAAKASNIIHQRQEDGEEAQGGGGSGGGPAVAANGGAGVPAAVGPGPRAGVIRPARRVATFGTRDEQRTNIWCTLVFRMLVWLLLHDFDKHDVQVSKSELMGSRLPVYIV